MFLLAPASQAIAVAVVDPWTRWSAHDHTSHQRIDHGPFEQFLLRYLRPGQDGQYLVAYGKVGEQGRDQLDNYLYEMSLVEISSVNRSEQMAYWINLYNALTLDLVLDHYPIASVRRLKPEAFIAEKGPWDRAAISVEDTALSLNDIIHRILRPTFADPRLHYALSCAALGCPDLHPEPFTGAKIERQLNEAAMAFVNDPRCVEIKGQKLIVSSLYRWYRDDFGGSQRATIHHITAFAKPDLAMKLQHFDSLQGDRFDWRLNDARHR